MATTQPVDSHLNLVQNDLPIPSSVGIDPDHGLPRTNQATNQTTQDPQQELHLTNWMHLVLSLTNWIHLVLSLIESHFMYFVNWTVFTPF